MSHKEEIHRFNGGSSHLNYVDRFAIGSSSRVAGFSVLFYGSGVTRVLFSPINIYMLVLLVWLDCLIMKVIFPSSESSIVRLSYLRLGGLCVFVPLVYFYTELVVVFMLC